MHRSADKTKVYKVPTKLSPSDEEKKEAAREDDDDQKKMEAGQLPMPQEVPTVDPSWMCAPNFRSLKFESDQANQREANRREKFAEAGGFDVDYDPLEDQIRQGFPIPSTKAEIADAGKRWGDGSWQTKLLEYINSDFVQKVLVGLLVLDVMVLFVELGELLNDRTLTSSTPSPIMIF